MELSSAVPLCADEKCRESVSFIWSLYCHVGSTIEPLQPLHELGVPRVLGGPRRGDCSCCHCPDKHGAPGVGRFMHGDTEAGHTPRGT